MSRFVVRHHRPLKTRILAAMIGIALLAGGWSLYEYGRYRGGYDRFGAAEQRSVMASQVRALEMQLGSLREENAGLERARQVERQAYDDLNTSLKGLQQELLELKEELAFYRGIVSPREAERGLRLQSFRLEPTGHARTWRYKLVLTQVLKNDTLVRGTVTMRADGLLDGLQHSVPLSELSENSVTALKYGFKYFQNFEGQLVLPEGYAPERLTVEIRPRGSQRDRIEQTYDWPA